MNHRLWLSLFKPTLLTCETLNPYRTLRKERENLILFIRCHPPDRIQLFLLGFLLSLKAKFSQNTLLVLRSLTWKKLHKAISKWGFFFLASSYKYEGKK